MEPEEGKMIWENTGRKAGMNRESTTFYESKDGYRIESRKRAIPHAGGRSGFWMHTTYFLIRPNGTEKEFYSLRDAKAAAEAEVNNDKG